MIGSDGQQVGVVMLATAMAKAKEEGLDLVEISPNVNPPVCRIMDHGKYRFDRSKKKSAQKKKQKNVQVKEVKFRPVTDVGDYKVKVKKITAFLERGDKVKVTLRFRGREMQHKGLGMELFDRIKQDLPEGLVVEQEPAQEGRQMIMVVSLAKQEGNVKRENKNAKDEGWCETQR